MIGTLFRWFRRTMPPAWAVLLALFLYLFMEGLFLWSQWNFDKRVINFEGSINPFLKMRDGIATIAMIGYGIFRVMAFHPLFRKNYRDWLAQTPWNACKPLPLGPIHLIWQDMVILGIVMLALHDSDQGRLLVLGSFLIAYLLTLGLSFWQTGPWWMGYIVLFGIALSIFFAAYPVVTFAVLAVMYVIAVIGCGMVLRRFPWPESKMLEDFKRTFIANAAIRKKPIVSWPFTRILEVPTEGKVRLRDGFLAPLLAAWWIYALGWNITGVNERMTLTAVPFAYGTFFAFLGRLITYFGSYRPPISILGRIATRRLIIPGYDYVLLAPLCMAIVAFLGAVIGIKAGPDYGYYVFPITMAAVYIIALNMGPTIRKWQLTGHHRTVPCDSGTKDANRVKL